MQISPVIATGSGSSTSTSNDIVVLSTTNNINGTSVAATTIYTVPTGKTFVFVEAVARLTSIAGGGNPPNIKINDLTSGVDIASSTSLTGLNGTTKFFPVTLSGVSYTAAAGDVIECSVTFGATYSTYFFSLDLIGYLL